MLIPHLQNKCYNHLIDNPNNSVSHEIVILGPLGDNRHGSLSVLNSANQQELQDVFQEKTDA